MGDVISMRFNLQDFWVQVYNVPLICIIKAMGIQIGNRIRQAIDNDVRPSVMRFGRYLHVRVRVDVSLPILWSL